MPCTYRNRAETVLAYVRQELNPQAQEAFEAHYFVCEECASEVLFYEKAVLTMQGQGGIVFARAKQKRMEAFSRIYHVLSRASTNWGFGEGGAVRALAGYAILIIFLSASSLGLLKLMDDSSTTALQPPPDMVAASPLGISSSGVNTPVTHVDWPQNLQLTADAAWLPRLESIRELYQSQKNYSAAENALAQLPDTLAGTDAVQLFLAVCKIQQNKKAEAELHLAAIATKPHSAYRQQAKNLLHLLSKK